MHDQRRKLVVRQLNAALAGKGLNRRLVVATHVRWQRRLVGEQRLRRWQAACKVDPDTGEQCEQSGQDPARTADPHLRPPWIDDLVHPLIEGYEVGQLPIWDVQSLELHLGEASSLSMGRRKAG